MKNVLCAVAGAAALLISAPSTAQTTLTVATVNNSDMIRMQGLTSEFTAKNPDITVKWVTLEENVLRQRVTTDIATKGGQFDVLTIGTYEVPIWGKKGWLVPLTALMTQPIFCPPLQAASPSTASLWPHRSTAKAPWSCTARTSWKLLA